MTIFGPISYLLAALLYLVLTVLVATGWQRQLRAGLLMLAALMSAAWAIVQALQVVAQVFTDDFVFIAEVLRDAAWLVFLVSILQRAGSDILSPTLRWAAYLAPAGMLAIGLLPLGLVEGPEEIFVSGSIVLSLIGLALVERVYGSSDPAVRKPIVYLTIAMVGIFGYDLVLYSSAVLTGQIEPGLWIARGMANALVVPFIAVAARRNRDWPVDMFVSRQVAYFGITFFGAGVYLVLMAVGGYYVKEFGGDWGTALAAILVFGGAVLLVALLLSDRLRRRAKVFLSKHFFRNRYDYREEWRNLTQALYHPDDEKSLGERSIEAVARILNSRSGLLLRKNDEGNALLPHAWWHRNEPERCSVAMDESLASFLRERQWVIDTREFGQDPHFYEGLVLPEWLAGNDHQQIVAPLLQEAELVGILVLDQEHPIGLMYEDTDLLKIVGRQIAGLLNLQMTSDKLAESRQFQAYSRLTAFLMHDLKNVAAQLSLVVKNAATHRNNPEFVEDAFKTIEHSVQRMNRLIAQLAERDRKERRQRVDLASALQAAIEGIRDRRPVPEARVDTNGLWISADRDRLFAVFYHLLRNAQDACRDDGEIAVTVSALDDHAVVEIADNGVGMAEAFIRDRLFKPFESTKGVDGMGIGAYQAREYVRELGGDIRYDSAPGAGTTVTVSLPLDGLAERAGATADNPEAEQAS